MWDGRTRVVFFPQFLAISHIYLPTSNNGKLCYNKLVLNDNLVGKVVFLIDFKKCFYLWSPKVLGDKAPYFCYHPSPPPSFVGISSEEE
jgi:hypothetical protein